MSFFDESLFSEETTMSSQKKTRTTIYYSDGTTKTTTIKTTTIKTTTIKTTTYSRKHVKLIEQMLLAGDFVCPPAPRKGCTHAFLKSGWTDYRK